jgi:RNA polymerase sigma-54 factor
MALELKQQLRLSQQLVMTPQLQQAIKLLQLSRLELVNLVEQEMQENPVLEEAMELEPDETPADVERESTEATEFTDASSVPEPAELPEGGEVPEVNPADLPLAQDLASVDVTPGDEREPSDAEKMADVDWQNYLESNPHTGLREARGEDDRPSIDATLTRRATLTEHLVWQLQLIELSEDEGQAAQFIVGNLDDRGFLRSSIEEIVRASGLAEEVIASALAKVQTLDPTGVASRDLRECLAIQIKTHGIHDRLVAAIIGDAEVFALFVRRDFRGVSRKLGVTPLEVQTASAVIGTLEPRPGRAFGGEDPVYIVPDIYVYKLGDDFHVVLNDDGLPRLRINNLYRGVLANGKDTPKETKTYVHDKVRSAMWLIKSIHQRQRTIYKVMQSIIRFQREFFDKGISFLKPLNLRDVADDIEMHESTVSRVTTNKYANTPQGIFELKYFFNSSINKLDGESIASESVKDKISHLIRNEDPLRPLSDQRIAEMLRVHNINIARRTVTKYREALNLLSSTKRRQVG